jgi:hypothetical protein
MIIQLMGVGKKEGWMLCIIDISRDSEYQFFCAGRILVGKIMQECMNHGQFILKLNGTNH